MGIIVINPTFDSVGETKITSYNYDAEFGQAIAGVASVQTKSGTNRFRGSVFEYLQRDRFQARNPFSQASLNPLTGKFIPDTKRDQFGGSIGGPIIRERFFFFGDYQGTRATQGGSRLLTVPTALARTGNLSEYGIPIYNPATGLHMRGTYHSGLRSWTNVGGERLFINAGLECFEVDSSPNWCRHCRQFRRGRQRDFQQRYFQYSPRRQALRQVQSVWTFQSGQVSI